MVESENCVKYALTDIDLRQQEGMLLTKCSAIVSYQLLKHLLLFIQHAKTAHAVTKENMLVCQCGAKWKRNCENYITILLGVMTRISVVTNCTCPPPPPWYVGKKPTFLSTCILFVPMQARESFQIKLCVGTEIYAFTLKF